MRNESTVKQSIVAIWGAFQFLLKKTDKFVVKKSC